MPKPGGDLAELELSQLLEELAMAKDTHFKLRLRNATGQLDNTSELQRVRRTRMSGQLRIQHLVAPVAQGGGQVDPLQEVRDPAPAAREEDRLVDVADTRSHRLCCAPGPGLASSRTSTTLWPASRRDMRNASSCSWPFRWRSSA